MFRTLSLLPLRSFTQKIKRGMGGISGEIAEKLVVAY